MNKREPTTDPVDRDLKRQILLAPRFLVVTAATFAFWMSVFAHTPLIPLYLADLDYSESAIGVIFGSGAVAALVARLVFGWMIDRYGERVFMLIGGLIWVVTAPLIPATEDPVLITAVWLAKGAGLAIFTTASGGWAGKYGPDSLRGRTMSVYGAANFAAAVLSPALAVALAETVGYMPAFLATGGTAALACCAALVPNIATERSEAPAGTRDRWWDHAIERRALPPGLIGAAVAAAFSAFSVYMPLRVADLNDFNSGLVLSVYAVTTIVILPVVGRTYDHLGRSTVLVPALLSLAAGLCILSVVTHPAAILGAAVLVGAGIGSSIPGLTAWAADRVDVAHRAGAQGTFWTVYEVGLFGGSFAMGVMFAYVGYGGFAVLAGAIVLADVLYVLTLRRNREQRDQGVAP